MCCPHLFAASASFDWFYALLKKRQAFNVDHLTLQQNFLYSHHSSFLSCTDFVYVVPSVLDTLPFSYHFSYLSSTFLICLTEANSHFISSLGEFKLITVARSEVLWTALSDIHPCTTLETLRRQELPRSFLYWI